MPANFFQPAASESGFEPITVPGNWTMQGYDKPHYTNVQMPWKNDPPFVPQDDNPTGLYTISGTGEVSVKHRVVANALLPELPRIGITMQLTPGLETLEWFGRGPHESYCDRKEGTPVDLYKSTVTGQYVPYGMPQEHGNKVDVRWMSLAGQRKKVVFRAHKLMECSVSHFTADDLFNAFHTNELKPRQEVIVNLDYRQRGLGTGSCGPQTLEKYQVKPGAYEFGYTIAVEPGSGKG